tara:strand:+ start:828 stop:953 length:126 start_codon:yes stop_codon:yes gene_type:complete
MNAKESNEQYMLIQIEQLQKRIRELEKENNNLKDNLLNKNK